MSKGMHSYCGECGSLITNAIGECYSCINEAQNHQEPWECDEFMDYKTCENEDFEYEELVGDYD